MSDRLITWAAVVRAAGCGRCATVAGRSAEGIAVHIGARITAQARPCEVLLSSIVRDLAAGSGIDFEDRGVREPRGFREWPLFAARVSERAIG